MKFLLVAIAMLALCGCAAQAQQVKTVEADIQAAVAPVKTTTLADAQACVQTAQARNDPDGLACCQSIATALQNQSNVVLPPVVGVLSALEAARTFTAPTIPPDIHRNCAVLIVDAQEMALKLGLHLAPAAGVAAVKP